MTVELAALLERHTAVDGPVAGLDVCGDDNQPWPCDAAVLRDHLTAAYEALAAVLRTHANDSCFEVERALLADLAPLGERK